MDKLDKILDCRELFEKDKKDISQFIWNNMLHPSLEIILVNNEITKDTYAASKAYANALMKDCEEVEIGVKLTEFSGMRSYNIEDRVIRTINKSTATAILVGLPIFHNITDHEMLQTIPWYKDVDGVTTINRGGLFEGDSQSYSATVNAIYDLLKKTHKWNIPMEGKHCVIINRSNMIGKPLSMMFMHEGATVTVCNSHTVDLKKYTQDADILVVAVGKPKFITADMVKPNSIVIDVGTNVDENGKVCGDVDFENVKEVVGHITPVPNGIGLMTRSAMLENIAWCALYQKAHAKEIKQLESLKKNTLWKTPFNQRGVR